MFSQPANKTESFEKTKETNKQLKKNDEIKRMVWPLKPVTAIIKNGNHNALLL